MLKKRFINEELGMEADFGKVANQAHGSVWLKQGGTVVLATVVTSKLDDFPGFLPLSVDYREMFSSVGKIPGGYFKREGRFTDQEVLTSRLIDRSIRPLFPDKFFNQLQVIITVYSADKKHLPGRLALLAASTALTVSKVPFIGPIGCAELVRKDGQWVLNPSFDDIQQSSGHLIVSGNENGICMVEGSADEMSEEELLDGMFMAHEQIKKQVAWQKEMQAEVGVPEEEVSCSTDWVEWEKRATEFCTEEAANKVFVPDKPDRSLALDGLKEEFLKKYASEAESSEISSKLISYLFDKQLKTVIGELIFKKGNRVDGRAFEQVRPISVEVGVLPFGHGSAIFTRGRTQALVTTTLGSGHDEQRVETLMGDTIEKSFMLHYNFPPFSVGEARPLRPPSRREVGHGFLALSAIRWMLPSRERFPYTIRLVAEMLESNGSTSMATVCGSTMSLMDAGVPIKKMVSGVAMGLMRSSEGQFQVVTDITGFEDAFGMMDFKVAGTTDGITAIQMDIKYKDGLPRQVMENALSQARRGRDHILGEMRTVMSKPNEELSEMVPKVVIVKVSTDRIGGIIGTGGKIVKEIVEKTGTSVDIEDDGSVKIFGVPGDKMDKAITWVKILGGAIEPGVVVDGRVRRVAEFGVFVEVAPGKDGLVHVSVIPREKQREMSKHYRVDESVKVEIMSYDDETGRIRLKPVA